MSSNFFCTPRFSSSSFRIPPRYSSRVITVASMMGSSICLISEGSGKLVGGVHFDDFPDGVGDPVPHAGRRGDEVDVELALEALLDNFQVQQPQKSAAETETQRHGVFGFEVEGAVVE